jgi:MinD superfamily P-loop ATPase
MLSGAREVFDSMKEMVVLSGKGGTGKTSILASFASLAERPVVADCDVDAADLHLVLSHWVKSSSEFLGAKCAVLNRRACIACGRCFEVCRFDALIAAAGPSQPPEVDAMACEGCGACTHVCTTGALRLEEVPTGTWFISESRVGPMVHARLGAGQEASGRLVTLVRSKAQAIAKRDNRTLVLIDGPPGIGCPVIASMTGTDLAFIVTEPSVSGLHDLERVVELAGKLQVPVAAAINKWDVSPDASARIEALCSRLGVPVVGRIPYDDDVTAAQIAGLPVVDYSTGPASRAMNEIWSRVHERLTS